MRWLLVVLALAAPVSARAEGRWHCSVSERIDDHVSAYLETVLGAPGAPRRHVDFYVSWAEQPGYMAEQQFSWIAIPVDETRLWKPDRITFGISGERTDAEGFIRFRSFPAQHLDPVPARSMVQSLRPHFQTTHVTVDEPGLRARLWSGGDWTAEHYDRQAASLGSARLLLPAEPLVQPLFARMRAELERKASDPERSCREIAQLTAEELQEQQVHWGTRIARPELVGPASMPDED